MTVGPRIAYAKATSKPESLSDMNNHQVTPPPGEPPEFGHPGNQHLDQNRQRSERKSFRLGIDQLHLLDLESGPIRDFTNGFGVFMR